ncbi:L-fuculokinase [Paenibacillaceae bacterium WGS1546]|uniref:FGGY-family carbohydrate kinase n=1 Tax=Cohnella sp. WGS1546 TaxID=3366810 RepID=UPI00372D2B0A
MYMIGIDIGTTHCKAGLFERNGRAVRLTGRPTVSARDREGLSSFDPIRMWEAVAEMLGELAEGLPRGSVGAIGVASMAESGLLVDGRTGEIRSEFIPWYDQRTRSQAERIGREIDEAERFRTRGLRVSYKHGLPKLLWLQEHRPAALNGSVWLNSADYIAFRLTGKMSTHYTLAARTYAYDLRGMAWDSELTKHFGLMPSLFPQVQEHGRPMGFLSREIAALTGIAAGVPVAIAGHDHLCAALAVGATEPGEVYNSMGTAETLIGVFGEFEVGDREYRSGLSYGRHVVDGRSFWMGGIPSSGGSVEWLRAALNDPRLSYGQIADMLERLDEAPTGLLYYPYLSGSGSPRPNPQIRGAIIGFGAEHTRETLLKAALEGTAYEFESIRRAGERASGAAIERVTTVGGGAKNRCWIRIKADVTGCGFLLPRNQEATLLGAAMLAGIAGGLYDGADDAIRSVRAAADAAERIDPDASRHAEYGRLYETGYLYFRDRLHDYFSRNTT